MKVCLALTMMVVLAGCQTAVDPRQACMPSAEAYGGTLAGAFHTTVGRLQAFRGNDPFGDPENGHPAIVCFVDAEFAKSPPLGPNGERHPNFDRGVIGIVDGTAVLMMLGYRDQVPVAPP